MEVVAFAPVNLKIVRSLACIAVKLKPMRYPHAIDGKDTSAAGHTPLCYRRHTAYTTRTKFNFKGVGAHRTVCLLGPHDMFAQCGKSARVAFQVFISKVGVSRDNGRKAK